MELVESCDIEHTLARRRTSLSLTALRANSCSPLSYVGHPKHLPCYVRYLSTAVLGGCRGSRFWCWIWHSLRDNRSYHATLSYRFGPGACVVASHLYLKLAGMTSVGGSRNTSVVGPLDSSAWTGTWGCIVFTAPEKKYWFGPPSHSRALLGKAGAQRLYMLRIQPSPTPMPSPHHHYLIFFYILNSRVKKDSYNTKFMSEESHR